MALTGRFVLVALAGAAALLLFPSGWTALWAALLLAAGAALDLALAASPRQLRLERRLPASVRLTEQCTSELVVTNTGRRGMRAQLRDGWQPSAGAVDPVQRLDL
ncbi:hypothetical protein D477_016977, partial [Arthrobacter crystallopoietes BAB-32]